MKFNLFIVFISLCLTLTTNASKHSKASSLTGFLKVNLKNSLNLLSDNSNISKESFSVKEAEMKPKKKARKKKFLETKSLDKSLLRYILASKDKPEECMTEFVKNVQSNSNRNVGRNELKKWLNELNSTDKDTRVKANSKYILDTHYGKNFGFAVGDLFYHSTSLAVANIIKREGVKIQEGRVNAYGKGFYTKRNLDVSSIMWATQNDGFEDVIDQFANLPANTRVRTAAANIGVIVVKLVKIPTQVVNDKPAENTNPDIVDLLNADEVVFRKAEFVSPVKVITGDDLAILGWFIKWVNDISN